MVRIIRSFPALAKAVREDARRKGNRRFSQPFISKKMRLNYAQEQGWVYNPSGDTKKFGSSSDIAKRESKAKITKKEEVPRTDKSTGRIVNFAQLRSSIQNKLIASYNKQGRVISPTGEIRLKLKPKAVVKPKAVLVPKPIFSGLPQSRADLIPIKKNGKVVGIRSTILKQTIPIKSRSQA